ncbi:uncharacterized protein [Nicotiana sylvestris]|uniref:uncharacterized protein n=1 Tax=Nicotiana sylvestris TaxID=4096 RepID=UPI00388C7253
MGSTSVWASHGEEDMLGDYFAGIDMDTDLDAPIALEKAENLKQQVKKLYDHTFSKLQEELSCREKELEKLTSKLNKSEASSARQEEELGDLRIGQKDALVGQLREEVAANDAEILELKRQNGVLSSEKDLLRGEMPLLQMLEPGRYLKRPSRSWLGPLLMLVSELGGRPSRKQTEGVDLSIEIEKAIILEERSAPSASSDEDSGSDSNGSEGEEWPAKRPHIQQFTDRAQVQWDWLTKENEYRATIRKLEKQVRELQFENSLQVAADKGEKKKLAKENEALRAQIQKLKVAVESPVRSDRDEKLIANLRQKVSDYSFDLNKAESELAKAQKQLAKNTDERVRLVKQLRERYDDEIMNDLDQLQMELAYRPAARPNDAPRALGALMYS